MAHVQTVSGKIDFLAVKRWFSKKQMHFKENSRFVSLNE